MERVIYPKPTEKPSPYSRFVAFSERHKKGAWATALALTALCYADARGIEVNNPLGTYTISEHSVVIQSGDTISGIVGATCNGSDENYNPAASIASAEVPGRVNLNKIYPGDVVTFDCIANNGLKNLITQK